ncbi:MAG TPA: hypothetical protein DCM08_01185 [Microscillaceae bacterium]|nr:hypothetical protein [Microscillaceae bacterium]
MTQKKRWTLLLNQSSRGIIIVAALLTMLALLWWASTPKEQGIYTTWVIVEVRGGESTHKVGTTYTFYTAGIYETQSDELRMEGKLKVEDRVLSLKLGNNRSLQYTYERSQQELLLRSKNRDEVLKLKRK